jgi:ABC-type amino acid transport substrate-binding protein
MLKKICLAAAALAMCVISSCSTTEDSTYKRQSQLRVGITANMPPMIYKFNDKVLGIEADFAEELAKALEKELKYVELDWTEQIAALENGDIDIIMSGMTVTEPRRRHVNFTMPYMLSGLGALIRKADYNRLQVRTVLLNNRGGVGVEKGTTGDELVTTIMPVSKKYVASNIYDLRDLLIDKKVDAVVHDFPTLWFAADVKKEDNLTVAPYSLMSEHIAWAVGKSNYQLMKQVDDVLLQWQKNGKTESILKKWLPEHSRFSTK